MTGQDSTTVTKSTPAFDYRIGRDSSVGIETGYGLDGQSSIPAEVRFFSSPQRPDRLWGQPSLLSNGYRELFRRG
jgi:hypothetical protein